MWCGQRTQLYIFILWNLWALLSVAQNLPRFCGRPPVCPRTRTPCSLDALSSVFMGLSLLARLCLSSTSLRMRALLKPMASQRVGDDRQGGWIWFSVQPKWFPGCILRIFHEVPSLKFLCLPHTFNLLALCSNLYLSLILIHTLSDDNIITQQLPFPLYFHLSIHCTLGMFL